MEEQRDLVALEDAAPRLGVSADALRKRLERGKTIKGVKLGHQWYVYAADVPPPAASNGQVQTADVSVQENPPDTSSAASAVSSAALQAAVDALAAQLAVKDQQIADLHAVVAQLGQERLALPAPAPATAAAATAVYEATIAAQAETIGELRRRADQAEREATALRQLLTAPVSTAAAVEASAPSEPPAAPAPAEPPRRHWWQVWRT